MHFLSTHAMSVKKFCGRLNRNEQQRRLRHKWQRTDCSHLTCQEIRKNDKGLSYTQDGCLLSLHMQRLQTRWQDDHKILDRTFNCAHFICIITIVVSKYFNYLYTLYWNVIYRVSQEESAILRENVPYVKVHRYNPKYLYPKLNGYGDNGQRNVWSSCGSTYCTC
jgi:hypothetical protein